jgi:hypothetical protein
MTAEINQVRNQLAQAEQDLVLADYIDNTARANLERADAQSRIAEFKAKLVELTGERK